MGGGVRLCALSLATSDHHNNLTTHFTSVKDRWGDHSPISHCSCGFCICCTAPEIIPEDSTNTSSLFQVGLRKARIFRGPSFGGGQKKTVFFNVDQALFMPGDIKQNARSGLSILRSSWHLYFSLLLAYHCARLTFVCTGAAETMRSQGVCCINTPNRPTMSPLDRPDKVGLPTQTHARTLPRYAPQSIVSEQEAQYETICAIMYNTKKSLSP